MKSSWKKLGVEFPYMAAPMVGLSHVAFRELVRTYIPKDISPLLFTEMLSTKRLPSQHLHSSEALYTAIGERNFIPQLLGNEEVFIAPSIERLLSLSPWGFDINMGCPATNILKHNWGVRLMGDKDYAANVVRVTKSHSPKPVSVKLRSADGEKQNLEYLLDFTDALEKAGADWITIHARAKGSEHRGQADWQIVGEVAKRRGIPVVSNGDIQTAEDAINVIDQYGASGAMIARALSARPWIFWQIHRKLGNCKSPAGFEHATCPETPEEEGAEYGRACYRFANLLEEYFGDSRFALKKFHFFVLNGSRWLMFGHSFWKETQRATNLREAKEIVSNYCHNHPQHMVSRVNLS